MKFLNPLQMNDWSIRNFLCVVLSIQLAFWGFIGLDIINLQLPILRQIVSFVYLIFLPGILILRILKLHNLGNIETLLISIGLSISTLMFLGYFINSVYLHLSISNPLSYQSLIISLCIFIFILSYICFKIDNDYCNPHFIDTKNIFSIPALCLFNLPVFAIFATYFKNLHHINTLMILLLLMIVTIILVIGFFDLIPDNLYPLAIFSISLSLLLHTSLISNYIVGWDIQTEYLISNLVIKNSYWDTQVYSNVNSMLSIAILAPIFSAIVDMDLVWVFKILYPCIFSIVPLGLYKIFQKQTDNKIAFFSAFFFVSLFSFYFEMPQLARQQIAELYLVLIILLWIIDDINKSKKSLLVMIFTFSMVVSHYGLSYIFVGLIFLTWIIFRIKPLITNRIVDNAISRDYLMLTVVITLSWYMNTSSSSPFVSIIHISDHIISSIFSELMNPNSAQGIDFITRNERSLIHSIYKYIHIFTQLLITVGLLDVILRFNHFKFKKEYVVLCVVNYIILVAGIIVPFFASSLNTSRLYQISLIFLAPLLIIGFIVVLKKINNTLNFYWKNRGFKSFSRPISIFFVGFLMFNSGLIFELLDDSPTSIALSTTLDYPQFNEKDVTGAIWITNQKTAHESVYADYYRWLVLLGLSAPGESKIKAFSVATNTNSKESYHYFGTYNTLYNKVAFFNKKGTLHNLVYMNLFDVVSDKNKIYTNNGATIYY